MVCVARFRKNTANYVPNEIGPPLPLFFPKPITSPSLLHQPTTIRLIAVSVTTVTTLDILPDIDLKIIIKMDKDMVGVVITAAADEVTAGAVKLEEIQKVEEVTDKVAEQADIQKQPGSTSTQLISSNP